MKNPIAYLRAWLTIRAAILQADLQFAATGKRHYVIPSQRARKLLVTSFHEEVHTQGLNNRHVLRPDYSHPATLMSQAFYYTPSSRSRARWRHGMPRPVRKLRRELFFIWYFGKK